MDFSKKTDRLNDKGHTPDRAAQPDPEGKEQGGKLALFALVAGACMSSPAFAADAAATDAADAQTPQLEEGHGHGAETQRKPTGRSGLDRGPGRRSTDRRRHSLHTGPRHRHPGVGVRRPGRL